MHYPWLVVLVVPFPLPTSRRAPFDGLRLRLVTSLLAARHPQCHKTRFLGRGQQSAQLSICEGRFGRVSIGCSLHESPNLVLLTKAHLAQLIDLGVGGRADKESDCLVDNSFAETRTTTPIANDANQLICAGAGRERGDARGASSRGRLPDNDVRPYWELAKMKPTGFVTPGRSSPHNLGSFPQCRTSFVLSCPRSGTGTGGNT